jgi:type IV pilus assembly protein PilC
VNRLTSLRRRAATYTAIERLLALASSGVALGDALKIAADAGGPGNEILRRAATRVARGLPLSRALPRAGAVLEASDIALISAGERSGDLTGTLGLLEASLRAKRDMRRKLLSALAYPIALLSATLCVAAFLSVVALPTFAQMYADDGRELPGTTRFAIATGRLVTDYGIPAIVLISLAVVGASVARTRSLRVRQNFDALAVRLPLLGGLILLRSRAELYGALSRMIHAGVDLETAFTLSIPGVSNSVMRATAQRLSGFVRRGLPPAAAVLRCGLDPTGADAGILRISEETGDLGGGFERVAATARELHEARVTALARTIEPVAVILLAVVVGGFVIALYQPMLGVPDMFAGNIR